MKHLVFVFASVAVFAISCTANPPIVPEPPNATTGTSGLGGNGGAGGSSGNDCASSCDRSGTRLKRYVYTSADGLVSVQSGRFYDTLLGIECEGLLTPKGLRCVPVRGPTQGSAIYYTDSLCTLAALYVRKECAPPVYQVEWFSVSCGGVSIKAWPMIPVPSPGYTTFGGGGCVPMTQQQQDAFSLFTLGPEVDYTQFAAMTLEHE
jgi:hypothetical protein